jgi:Virulence-associated protein E
MPINLDSASDFLEALGGQGPFTFQTFDDDESQKREALKTVIHGTLAGCAKTLERMNNAGAGVFVTVNETDGHGRKGTNVTGLRALFVDKDDGDFETPPPGANIRVRTAHGEHIYWLLVPDEPKAEFTPAQKRLIETLGTDTKIHDLPRVMRLPGFWHQKDPANPFMVEAWYDEDQPRRTIPEVLALFPQWQALERRAERTQAVQPTRKSPTERLEAMISLLATALKGDRNGRLYKTAAFAGDIVAAGEMAEGDAAFRLWKACEQNGLATDEPEKTRNTIKRALSKDREDLKVRRNAKGDPLGTIGNVLHILSTHPAWEGVLGWDERRECPEIILPPPWDDELVGVEKLPRKITGADAGRLSAWLGWRSHMIVNSAICREALAIAAERAPFDRVREYLESLLAWDGQRRIATWLIKHAGADDTKYVRAVSGRWLISAVARTLEPGCKVDTMLILHGPQGIKKSTLLRILAGPEFFSDGMPPVDTKDAKIHVHGPWVVEIPELSALSGRRGGAVKAFLSTQEDTFRRPYGAGETTSLRRCIFAGTANIEEFLDDETGGRRFWPVSCRGQIAVHEVAQIRDQLWAEALELYRAGEPWWLTDEEVEEARAAQECAYEADALEDAIAKAVDEGATSPGFNGLLIRAGTETVTVSEILDCVCGDSRERKTVLQKRIVRALRHLGWTPGKDGKGDRIWRKGVKS